MIWRPSLSFLSCLLSFLLLLAHFSNPHPIPINDINSTCYLCDYLDEESARRDADAEYVRVVDVFYLFSRDSKKADYILKGYFWLIPAIAKVYAENEKSVRIHIFSDSDSIISSALLLGWYTYDIREYQKENAPYIQLIKRTMVGRFQDLCVYRWHMYNQHVIRWNANSSDPSRSPIGYIIALDADVVLTFDPVLFFNRLLRTIGYMHHRNSGLLYSGTAGSSDVYFEAIDLHLGAIELFSPIGLSRFSNFISKWYSGSDSEVMKRCSEFSPLFNDMILVEKFMRHDTSMSIDSSSGSLSAIRSTCYEIWTHGKYYGEFKSQRGNDCLLSLLQCVPMSSYTRMIQGRYNRFVVNKDGNGSRYARLQIFGSDEALPYCLIHFSGREGKEIMYAYIKLIYTQLKISSSVVDSLVPRHMVISHNKMYYYIDSTGSRYAVNMSDVVPRLVTRGDIVHVPQEVASAFPLSRRVFHL